MCMMCHDRQAPSRRLIRLGPSQQEGKGTVERHALPAKTKGLLTDVGVLLFPGPIADPISDLSEPPIRRERLKQHTIPP